MVEYSLSHSLTQHTEHARTRTHNTHNTHNTHTHHTHTHTSTHSPSHPHTDTHTHHPPPHTTLERLRRECAYIYPPPYITYMYSWSHSGEGPTDFHERAHARTHLIGLSSVPPMTMNSSKISLLDMPATNSRKSEP